MRIRAIDLFCGAGGTSTGLELACKSRGIELDLTAINHWTTAINTHSKNHPKAHHLCEPIELLKPREVCKDHLHILIASPECTHHSNARGGKPINDQSRATAFRVLEWAEALLPDYVLIENVPEFASWGPVDSHGKRIKDRKGEIFSQYIQMFRAIGYTVDFRILNAADYGDPTTRRRLFMIARRGDKPINWPSPTHIDPRKATDALIDDLKTWRPAREIINWDIQSQSIFTRKRPLARKTLERIYAGLEKFCGEAAEPFLVVLRNHMDGLSIDGPLSTVAAGGLHTALCEPFIVRYTKGTSPSIDVPLPTQTTKDRFAIAEPYLIEYHGGQHPGQWERSSSINEGMPTLDCSNRFALIQPFILPHRKFNLTEADDIEQPLRTIDATNGRQIAAVQPIIVPFFGERQGQPPRSHSIDDPIPAVTSHGAGAVVEPIIVDVNHGNGQEDPEAAARRRSYRLSEPLPTVTTAHGKALVTPFVIETPDGLFGLDIHLRMLTPRELASAMSFPDDYEFLGTKDEQVRQIGNAVPVGVAQALIGSILDTYEQPARLQLEVAV